MTFQIVVVDDDDIDRYLVQRIVKSLDVDAKVVEYDDGVPFIEVVRDRARLAREIGQPPPRILVLLDINMPGMSGFEVLETLKQELGQADQTFVVTMHTSSNHAQDRADAEKYDFVTDYIVKPVTKEKLERLIRKLGADD